MLLAPRLKLASRYVSLGEPAKTVNFGELQADDVVLSDSAYLVDWTKNPIHLFLCDYCGGDDRPGGWLALRRSGHEVAWVPLFREIESSDFEYEYFPPDYVSKSGAPLTPYDELARVIPSIPPLSSIPELSGSEVLRLWQLEAKGALGDFPYRPRLVNASVNASSLPGQDHETQIAAQIERWTAYDRAVRLVAETEEMETVWVNLDLPSGNTDWYPLSRFRGEYYPRLLPGLVALPLAILTDTM